MTDEEALQEAVDAAEAEAQALEDQAGAIGVQRHALSAQELADLQTRRDELNRTLRALSDETVSLDAELQRLTAQLKAPGFRLPPRVATPLTWFFRSAAFVVYVGSLVAAYTFIRSPGLVLALVLGLPIAFVALMVAGSWRESGAANTPRSSAGQGEEPARVAAVDERVGTAPGGPGGDRGAALGAEQPRDLDGEGG
ncbi:MAG: hypothetical protein Q8L48_04710 [Archangium sp.]|nr:hypothetical protein [Archangium sp.]